MCSLPCEVVGCHQIALWVRIQNQKSRRETYLCPRCWQNLLDFRPLEAACYARVDREEVDALVPSHEAICLAAEAETTV